MIKVLLVDDHKMVLDGFSMLLEKETDIQKVGEVTDGHLAIKYIEALPVKENNNPELDVAVIDIEMAHMDGIETTRILKQKYPTLKVLILTMHDKISFLEELIEAKADGYILKNRGKEELIQAIRKIHIGEKYFNHDMMFKLLNKSKQKNDKSTDVTQLTKREKEVLSLITTGITGREIADKLFIADSTVETHRRNLIEKTKVKNTKELIVWAMKNGYDKDE